MSVVIVLIFKNLVLVKDELIKDVAGSIIRTSDIIDILEVQIRAILGKPSIPELPCPEEQRVNGRCCLGAM